MSGAVTTITDDRFPTEVLEAESTVVVDFWAAWCPPCRVMDPIVAGLAAERPDVRFTKLDVDVNRKTAAGRRAVRGRARRVLRRRAAPAQLMEG